MSTVKKLLSPSGTSRIEPVLGDRPTHRDFPEVHRPKKRPSKPAVSVAFAWRCPVCQATCDAPDEQSVPLCPVGQSNPQAHAQVAALQTKAKAQPNRGLAEILLQEADKRARQLRSMQADS